jgi:hypothetical protein
MNNHDSPWVWQGKEEMPVDSSYLFSNLLLAGLDEPLFGSSPACGEEPLAPQHLAHTITHVIDTNSDFPEIDSPGVDTITPPHEWQLSALSPSKSNLTPGTSSEDSGSPRAVSPYTFSRDASVDSWTKSTERSDESNSPSEIQQLVYQQLSLQIKLEFNKPKGSIKKEKKRQKKKYLGLSARQNVLNSDPVSTAQPSLYLANTLVISDRARLSSKIRAETFKVCFESMAQTSTSEQHWTHQVGG